MNTYKARIYAQAVTPRHKYKEVKVVLEFEPSVADRIFINDKEFYVKRRVNGGKGESHICLLPV